MIVMLLTEYNLELLSLTGGCTGLSESAHVKKPHCCKSHAMVQFNKGNKNMLSIATEINHLTCPLSSLVKSGLMKKSIPSIAPGKVSPFTKNTVRRI